MKKSIKYILIVFAFIILNFLFWKIGDDCLSNKINDKSNESVLTDLIFIGILALIMIGIARWIIGYLNFVPKTRNSKLILGVIVTFLIFGNTTIFNIKNITSRTLNDKNERIKLCDKIRDANYLAYGTTAKELTFKEYNQIRNLLHLPFISNESYDISYLYSYDGFLPDYRLEISYKLPKEIKVEVYNKEEGYDFGEGRRIEEFEKYNLVHYSEYNR
ncbi:MAG: hypothetical protein AB8H03_01685 [Saprospiraceae bacterium]